MVTPSNIASWLDTGFWGFVPSTKPVWQVERMPRSTRILNTLGGKGVYPDVEASVESQRGSEAGDGEFPWCQSRWSKHGRSHSANTSASSPVAGAQSSTGVAAPQDLSLVQVLTDIAEDKKVCKKTLCHDELDEQELRPLQMVSSHSQESGAGMQQKSPTVIGEAGRHRGIVRVSHKDVWHESEPGDDCPVVTVSDGHQKTRSQATWLVGGGVHGTAGLCRNTRAEWPSNISEGANEGCDGNADLRTALSCRLGRKFGMENVMKSELYLPAFETSKQHKMAVESVSMCPVSNMPVTTPVARSGCRMKKTSELHAATRTAAPGLCSHRMADSVQSIGFGSVRTPTNGQPKSFMRSLQRSKSDIDLSDVSVQQRLDANGMAQAARFTSGDWCEKLNLPAQHETGPHGLVAQEKIGARKIQSRLERYVKKLPLIRSLVSSDGQNVAKDRGSERAAQENPRIVCMPCFRPPTPSLGFRYEDEEVHVQRTFPFAASKNLASHTQPHQSKHMQSFSPISNTSASSNYKSSLRPEPVNPENKPSLSLNANSREWQPSVSFDADIIPRDCQESCDIWNESLSAAALGAKNSKTTWSPPVFKTDEEYAMRQLEHCQKQQFENYEELPSMGDFARPVQGRLWQNTAAPSKESVDESAWDECSIPEFEVGNLQWWEPDRPIRRSVSFSDFGVDATRRVHVQF